jgi:hypothetical protein
VLAGARDPQRGTKAARELGAAFSSENNITGPAMNDAASPSWPRKLGGGG